MPLEQTAPFPQTYTYIIIEKFTSLPLAVNDTHAFDAVRLSQHNCKFTYAPVSKCVQYITNRLRVFPKPLLSVQQTANLIFGAGVQKQAFPRFKPQTIHFRRKNSRFQAGNARPLFLSPHIVCQNPFLSAQIQMLFAPRHMYSVFAFCTSVHAFNWNVGIQHRHASLEIFTFGLCDVDVKFLLINFHIV